MKDRQIDIMGIVNLTDDSYFEQSRRADGRFARFFIRKNQRKI